ncbi:hypothetical protein ACJX0J_007480, partial [Zea mays]
MVSGWILYKITHPLFCQLLGPEIITTNNHHNGKQHAILGSPAGFHIIICSKKEKAQNSSLSGHKNLIRLAKKYSRLLDRMRLTQIITKAMYIHNQHIYIIAQLGYGEKDDNGMIVIFVNTRFFIGENWNDPYSCIYAIKES